MCVVLVVGAVTAVAPASVGRAQTAHATIATSASDASAAAPGALAVADVLVDNRGLGSSGTPVELTVATPAGVTVEGLITGEPYEWACSPGGTATTCTLVDRQTGAAAALEGEDVVDGHLTVALDPSVVVGDGLSVDVSVAVPGEGGAAPDLTAAATTILFPPLPADQAFALDVRDDASGALFAGRGTSVTTSIRNLGPGSLGGPQAPTTVTGVLPPVPTEWTAEGAGWSCADDGGTPACTWSGAAVTAGSSLPDLVIHHVAPPTVTPEGEPLSWPRTVTAAPTDGGSAVEVVTDFTAIVVAAGQPEVAVTTTGPTPPSLERPGTVDVGVTVSGQQLHDPAVDVALHAELPAGFELSGLTSADPWVCDPDRTAVRCHRPADFGDAAASDVVLHLDVTAAAAVGPAPIVLVAVAIGEPDDRLEDNAAMFVVQVDAPPPAATALRLWEYDDTGVAVPTDGDAYELVPGVATAIGVDAVNDGSAPIEAGTTFVLTAVLPEDAGVVSTTDDGAPGWSCVAAPVEDHTTLECTSTLAEPIALDAALPRLRLDLTLPANAAAGDLAIPVDLTPSDPTASPQLRSAVDVPAVVTVPTATAAGPAVSIEPTVARTPRALGRNGQLTIDITNTGSHRITKVDVGIDLPTGVSVATEHPSTCTTKGGTWKDFDLVCTTGKKADPDERFDAVTLDLVAAAGAGSGDVLVVADPYGSGDDVDTTLALTVLPALVARATASPTTVHGQAFGVSQPTVLLDGRASDALEAEHVWRQVPEPGEPLVHLDGAAPGAGELRSPTASFTAPVVEQATDLHFALDVTDGSTASTATVVVTVEPIPVAEEGAETGWEDQQAAAPALAGLLAVTSAAATEPWWTWTRDPEVRRNSFDPPAPTPIRGSRMTLVDHGEFEFAEPTDPPERVEVGHEWLQCAGSGTSYDPASCVVIGVEESVVPHENGSIAVLRVTVQGERRGEVLETSRELVLGEVGVNFDRPVSVSAPQILGDPVVGAVLTGDPGRWTMEHQLAYQWMRCPDPPEFPFCFDVGGATGETYTVTHADIGHLLRLEVTSFSLEPGDDGVAESEFFGPIPDDGSAAPLEVTTDLPGGTTSVPNSAAITVHAGSTGGRGTVTFRWDQIAGPDVLGGSVFGPDLSITTPADGAGDLQFVVTATDTTGDTATAGITVTYGEVGVPGTLCEVLNEARAAGTGEVSFALGSAIVLTFSGATTSDGPCSESTTLDMGGASVDLFGWLRVTDLVVHVDADGIDLTGGTLVAQGDDVLGDMSFRLVASGLHIPFDLAGAQFHVAGAVIADSLPFLDLPTGWTAAAKLSFSSDAGEQSIGFDAVAWDSTAGEAHAVPDDLPVPPPEVPHLSLDGAAATDRSFSFQLTAVGLVELGDVRIDFSGTVARDLAGVFTTAATGALTRPVGLAPGITLESASLGWDGTRFTGSGALGVAANGGRLAVHAAFDFADARDWAATLSVAPDTGRPSWTPVDGFTITDAAVSGSIVREGSTTRYRLDVGAAHVTLGPDVALDDVLFTLDVACGATCATVLTLSAAATVTVADPPTTVTIAGTLDLGTGAFSFSASIAQLRPFDGLLVERVTLAMMGGAGQATRISLAGDAVVFDVPVQVVITESDLGFFLSVELGDWDPAAGAPDFSGARIVYSSYDTTVTVGSEVVAVPARSVLLTASTTAPAWFVDLVDADPGRMTVVGRVDLPTRDFRVTITFDLPAGTELFDVGGVSLELDRVGFLVDSTAGRITTSLSADAVLLVPAFEAGRPRSALAVSLAATFRPGPSGGLAASVTVIGQWRDAFGVPDLVVENMTVGVSIGTSTQLQFAGIVTLPSDWGQLIGVVPGTPIALVASVGGPGACFGLEVGAAGATEDVVDLGGAGAVTARHLSIVVAPTGCTVGAHILAPGMSLLFDGALFGTAVTVNATLAPAPFDLDVTITIGRIALDGFNLDHAELHVTLNRIERHLSFEADATVLGVSAIVRGSFTKDPTGTTVDLAGSFSGPDLGGFTLRRLDVTLHVEQRRGAVRIAATAAIDLDVLGAPQHVEFDFTLVNGRLDAANGEASIVIPIEHLRIEGTGDFHVRRGTFPTISITGTMTAGGHPLTQVSATLTGGAVDLDAELGTALGFASPPTLEGTIAWSSDGASTITIEDRRGIEVAADPGDFRFSAQDVTFGGAGFLLSVDVTIGFVDGVLWADLATTINLGSGRVAVAGGFASNGDFTISGTADLDLAGFDLPSGSFTVARAGGLVSVRGDVTWSVPKLAAVRFQGSFVRDPVRGVTYDLTGSGVVNPGGHRFGAGTFHIFRSAAGAGVKVDARIDVPGIAVGDVLLWVAPDRTLQFHVRLGMRGTIGLVLGSPTADVRYYNGPEVVLTGFTTRRVNAFYYAIVPTYATVQVDRLSMTATATNVLGLPSRVDVAGTIVRSSTGAHTYALQVSASFAKSSSKDLGICRASYSAAVSFSGSITGSANSLAISMTASTSAGAGCGRVSASVRAEFTFSYVNPATFTVKVKLVLRFGGVGTWKPTVYVS